MNKLDNFTINIYEKVNKIMDFMDFEKIHKVMEFLDWKWQTEEGLQVPEVYEIRRMARRLVIDTFKELCDEHQEVVMGSGGFETYGYVDDDGEFQCKFSFIVDSWETE